MLRRKDLSFRSGMTTVIGVALIDTPLSCSVNRVSVYLTGFSSPLPGRPSDKRFQAIPVFAKEFLFTCLEFRVCLHEEAVHEGRLAVVQMSNKSHRPNQLCTIHQISQKLHVVGGFGQLLLGNL